MYDFRTVLYHTPIHCFYALHAYLLTIHTIKKTPLGYLAAVPLLSLLFPVVASSN